MALKIKLSNGNEYEVLADTAVYPSGSNVVRNRIEIHMTTEAMGTSDFEALFMNESLTASMHLINDDEKVGFDTLYENYSYPARIGKERVTKYDVTTAKATDETHLVAVLEQYTYIEQQIKKVLI